MAPKKRSSTTPTQVTQPSGSGAASSPDLIEEFERPPTIGSATEDTNTVIAVAYFLDPRFKMKAVEFNLIRMYGKVLYRSHLEEFTNSIKHIYQEYASHSKIITEPQQTPPNADFETSMDGGGEFTEEADADFMNYVYASCMDGGDSNKTVGSILNDLEVMETMDANLTLEDLEDMEKQPESSDEEE
ncbi:hypothetical protein GUJ93_ZPchr0010g7617 [Zizania palustris]|uniref:hAT-like transposase RNase-H fold domain-containing protein n=1 Tax=Zizania palustris TaxID=103762 RepID=A0A8J6BN47_ZIZPA|nr:hypothetical protein GUJ93_ZPchr0010g7617 [Zizania palustris]